MPRGENRATAVCVGWPCVIPLFAKLQLSNSETYFEFRSTRVMGYA